MTDEQPLWRRLLDGWMQIAAHFGEVQTLVLMALIYAFVFGPAAVISRSFGSDFLGKRGLGETGSAWRDSDTRPPELENVKQPF